MLILGSQSKARYQLLRTYNAEIEVRVADIDESFDSNLSVEDNVKNIALQKAQYLIEEGINKDDILVCADTVVVVDDKILQKPTSYDDALEMILSLSNNDAKIITGVYLSFVDKVYNFSETSTVHFEKIDESIARKYLDETPYYLKISGALDINTIDKYTKYSISGSYSNIIGLPMETISKHLYDSEALKDVTFSTEKIDNINIYRSSVRALIFKDNKVLLLKGYTFDKKHTYYMSVGGGYHCFENKEEVLKKESQEEAGAIIKNIKYISTVAEYTTMNRYYKYNKETLHTYYYSDYAGEVPTSYIEYEQELLLGIEAFDLDEAIDIVQEQIKLFEELKYPIKQISESDLYALTKLKKTSFR